MSGEVFSDAVSAFLLQRGVSNCASWCETHRAAQSMAFFLPGFCGGPRPGWRTQTFSEPVATELEITELADREMKLPARAPSLEKPTVNVVVSPFPVAITTGCLAKRMASEHECGFRG